MKEEFSSGGIVYKPTTNNQQPITHNLLWLVCQHSQHKGWVFPKGLIGDTDDTETEEITAVREVKEETGINAKIINKDKVLVQFYYSWKGEKRKKTVTYFLMEHIGGDISQHDDEMQDVAWWTTEQVKQKLTYASDKHAFEEALKLYNNQNNE